MQNFSQKYFSGVVEYRHAYNGMEKDDEVKGDGNSYDYTARFYDPRIARFVSGDPLGNFFPWNSPYSYAENDVIRSIDLDGLEKLVKTVTSDPNSETGVPGQAKIVIQKEYMVVTSGPGAVNDPHRINSTAFTQAYDKGDGTLYLSQLPSANQEAISLEGKYLTWAQKANTSDKEKVRAKYANKLHEAGINYYVTEIDYQYSITTNPDVTLDASLKWMDEDPDSRGIVALQSDPSTLSDLTGSTGQAFKNLNNGAMMAFKEHPTAGGAAMDDDYDVIFLNPKTWNDDSKFSQNVTELMFDGTYDKYISYNRTEATVHEAGHASTGLKHAPDGRGNYEYNQTGLQSNRSGQVYPTKANTMAILNNYRNRLTIK